jgi:hypothetical protein
MDDDRNGDEARADLNQISYDSKKRRFTNRCGDVMVPGGLIRSVGHLDSIDLEFDQWQR